MSKTSKYFVSNTDCSASFLLFINERKMAVRAAAMAKTKKNGATNLIYLFFFLFFL